MSNVRVVGVRPQMIWRGMDGDIAIELRYGITSHKEPEAASSLPPEVIEALKDWLERTG